MSFTRPAAFLVLLSITTLSALLIAPAAKAEGVDVEHRPVSEVRVEGLVDVPQQLVFNQIRLKAGDEYLSDVVQQDLVRLRHLGRFEVIEVDVKPLDDGSVVVTYVFQEHAVLAAITITGNKEKKEEKLLELVLLQPGDPIDEHMIERSLEAIVDDYEKDGYFLTQVTYDEAMLYEGHVLAFQIREGPRLRIKAIEFEGNKTFTDKQLLSQIKSKTYILVIRKGELSRERLDADAGLLRTFYHSRGYLDAQVGRRIDVAPNQKEAKVVFFIDEGPLYTVANIRIEGNTIFSEQDILNTLVLKIGDIYSQQKQQQSIKALLDRYGKLGFLTSEEGGLTRVEIRDLFHPDKPMVDLLVTIEEGKSYTVGKISITGNQKTKDKVILRQLRGLNPARPFDRSGFVQTEQRLREHPVFSDAHITVLGDTQQTERDVLVEVQEQPTGSLSFGGGFGSDAGVFATLSMEQKNFDIGDLPGSLDDLIHGRSFYGAGQYFSIHLEPGNEFSRYSMRFREPYFMETNIFFDTAGFYFDLEREDYDEKRFGGQFGFGQRFGDVWEAQVNLRSEEINIGNIGPDAPSDVTKVMGDNFLSSVGFTLTRNSTDSRIFPTHGSNTSTTLSQTFGDFIFSTISAKTRKYWTVEEDFHGRRSVLTFRGEVGYMFGADEPPIYEKFYVGGHTSFRGFKHRGVGPHENKKPIGGTWKFLAGIEYNVPVYKDLLRAVFFVDSGTLTDDPGFSKYRASIGAGVRIKLPLAILQAPFALDFAVPIAREDDDETQAFSFALDLPF